MRKYVWLIGILIIALLTVPLVVGCGKKQQPQSGVTSAPAIPPPGPDTVEKPPAPAGEVGNTVADVLNKQKGLTSYVMSVKAGKATVRYAMKMDNGERVAMKMDRGSKGWTIIRTDKKMQYIYKPATKSALAVPLPPSENGAPSATGTPSPSELKKLVGKKVSSETVDGADCLKFASADGARTYWVDKEHGLPVQIKTGGKTVTFKYEQINSVPASEFEVPAGIKIEQVPIPKMAPGAPRPMPAMPKTMPSIPKSPG